MNKNPMIGLILAETCIVLLCAGSLVVMSFLATWTSPSKLKLAERRSKSFEDRNAANKLRADSLAQSLADSHDKTAELQSQAEADRLKEKTLRQELLGFQGSMDSAVFLIDISGSIAATMANGTARPNWGGDGSPWGFVRKQIDAWIEFLPVQRYRLIAFNDKLTEFPKGSDWASETNDSNEARSFLDSLDPTGTTATENAIRRAAASKPSNIVLITDGAPTNANGEFDQSQVDRILRYVSSDQFDIPINVVAVNNYFDRPFGEFLHKLAAASKGSFIGL